MFNISLRSIANKLFKQLPLRVILTVPFVFQVVVATSLVGYLSFRNGQKAVNELATQLQQEINDRIQQNVSAYLAVPVQLTEHNVDVYESGLIDFSNFKQVGQYFWKQAKVFRVSYIGFATSKGEFIGAGLYNDSVLKIEEVPRQTQGRSYIYSTNGNGDRTSLIQATNFDPRTEDWYIASARTGKPGWSQIYNWNVYSDIISISYAYPIYDQRDNLVGVVGTDLILSQMSSFLRQLRIGETGKAFILERSGLIVASSVDESLATIDNQQTKRLNAANSRDPVIRAVNQHLRAKFGSLDRVQTSDSTVLSIDGENHYVQVSPWRDQHGLDWLVVVDVPESDFMKQINANTRTTIELCMLALAVAILLGMFTARWLTQPILRLNQAAKAIAAGDFSQTVRFDRSDELGELAQSFNRMAVQLNTSFSELQSLNEALIESEKQLERYNQTLEQQVEERTLKLTQAMAQLQDMQAEIIQSEKLAALGQLVAGIAHEINTPLGAIQASIGNITSALDRSLQELPLLFQTLPPDRLAHFFTLLEWAQQPKILLSSREERQLKRTLKQAIVAHNLPNADTLATSLSKMGIVVAIDSILPLLQAPDAASILDTAYHLSAIQNNSQNIRLAVERAARIVYALKNYSRQNVSSSPIVASIPEGIDTVLTLYQNQIKRGIKVIKAYETVPSILCYPEELVQVWSNLINNAIQAMSYQGQLAIAVFAQDQHIFVEVGDRGCGIPEAIKNKIFEPFFTTKPSGEGSGLGLSIVRKIVDKHHGAIEVESEPGRTVFRVRLPYGFDQP